MTQQIRVAISCRLLPLIGANLALVHEIVTLFVEKIDEFLAGGHSVGRTACVREFLRAKARLRMATRYVGGFTASAKSAQHGFVATKIYGCGVLLYVFRIFYGRSCI